MLRALFFCLVCGVSHPAHPQQGEPLPRYSLKGASFKPAGTLVIPFNRPYSELPIEFKIAIKSHYQGMGDLDEPPFPLEGLAALYEPVIKVQSQMGAVGEFYAELKVDSSGIASEIAVKRSPSQAITNLVAGVALLTKFKPGICDGTPCAMSFPLTISFSRK